MFSNLSLNDYLDRLRTIMLNNNIAEREQLIDSILNSDEEVDINMKFIREIKDELSTYINWDRYASSKYFKEPDMFKVDKMCNCKSSYAKIEKFETFISLLYSEYRFNNDFKPETILSNSYHKKIIKEYGESK